MKKRIFFLLLLLGFALCLFAIKSEDTVLTLNFKSMLFSNGDPLEKEGAKTESCRLVNYHAHNGKSLTLILTDVNPFLYTVFIDGRAHEYFYDQKEFEAKFEQVKKEFEENIKKSGAEAKESKEDVRDSVKNVPDEKAKFEIQKNANIQKYLEAGDCKSAIAEIDKTKVKESLGNQIKEFIYLMNISDLHKKINNFRDDFNQLYLGLSQLTKNPRLGHADIVMEFFNLVRSRFPEFTGSPGQTQGRSDFQKFAQTQLAQLKREQGQIAKELVSKEIFQEKLGGLEDSIEAIENILQLFNEALVLFKEDAFMVRHVFPTIYGDEFVIRIKVCKKDSNEIVKELQPIRIHMANGTKIDFSAGIALGLNGADEEYVLDKSGDDGGKQKIVKNSARLVTPSPYALIHAYPRWLGRWIKLDFFCFGFGLNPNQTINYYVGTGFSGNTKRPIAQDDSNKIISDRRIVLNFGLVFTKIKTLAPRFEGMTVVDGTVKVEELLKESYKTRLFIGISYNF